MTNYLHILLHPEDVALLKEALVLKEREAKALLADENPIVVDKGQTILRQIHRIKKSIES